jgi:K(+)-stimulated pyrophosphate-energized sodium pump
MTTLQDKAAWPFCSPDWDSQSFRAAITTATDFPKTYSNGETDVDFPCDMTIDIAMILPIAASILSLFFVVFLYYVLLMPSPKGPEDEKDVAENYLDPDSANPETGEKWNELTYPAGKCRIPKDEQVEIGKKMNRISQEVQDGATAFLKEEYKYLSLFVLLMFAILLVLFTVDDNRTDRTDGIRVSSCFLIGAALSALAGWVGMKVATDANIRTTQAARKVADGGAPEGGLNNALRVAFTGGAVMGFTVVGLGLLGVSLMMVIMTYGRNCNDYKNLYIGETSTTDLDSCASPSMEDALDSLAGFGFGASSIALFARVAGGIYTKAADVGADLVGKVEEDIPEDSPENPATIADNVGDNVGDVAGMGADLFESFVGSIIATATLANGDIAKIAFPFWLAAAGIVASFVGFFAVSIGEEKEYRLTLDKAKDMPELEHEMFEANDKKGKILKYPYFQYIGKDNIATGEVWREDQEEDSEKHVGGACFVFDDFQQQADLMMALHKGTITSSVLVCGLAAVICYMLFDFSDYQGGQDLEYAAGVEIRRNQAWRIYGCVLIGLLCGILIGLATEYCTSYSHYPVKSIAQAGTTGPATVIIQGLGVGMMSCFPPTFIIVATILACNELIGDYGVAVAAVSMLSTLGVTLATDAYGPVADNAGGLAEMVEELPDGVRKTTDALDALGNTTAATGKGFAIGSAVLTSLSLLNAFEDRVSGETGIDTSVTDSVLLAGIVFGSMLPFLFGALTMVSVGLAAQELIEAVRDDFKVKKNEEVAAINATAEQPFKPWNFMGSKLGTQDKPAFQYYQESVEGWEGNRTQALQKSLGEFSGALPEAGFGSVTLKGLVKSDGNITRSEEMESHIQTEAHDVIDGARYHDGGADSFQLSGNFPRTKAEAVSGGQWDERQSIFDTKAWHSVRGWAPDSKRCIEISTRSSLKEMILPGVYAVFTPVFVGFLVGARCLLGLLAGSVGAGAMMAIMMSNAGGAWDNSKKYIEIAKAHGGKGTEIHKACVIGDTVGDPFKDTSGPALNILLKLMAVVALTISTLLKGHNDWELAQFSPIPGVIMAAATVYYCGYIYNQAAEANKSGKDSTEAPPSPAPKWFSGKAVPAAEKFQVESPAPAPANAESPSVESQM